ncbi:MAG: hypothetical protein Q8O14_14655 [bacterium]|nr:hypothetical protein [bacterium]
MDKDTLAFTLRLIFQKWKLFHIAFTGLGLASAIIAHREFSWWTINHTLYLVCVLLLISIIAKCISFAYSLFKESFPKIKAVSYIKGDGLNAGLTLIVFQPNQNIRTGQLITLFCQSSGARQPVLIARVLDSNFSEVQAVPVGNIQDSKLRKYFEEDSRKALLFATPEVTADNLNTTVQGGSHV